VDAVIGLASNLGDRSATLAQAAVAIAKLGRLLGASSLYETEPVGPPQPMFLNAALGLETDLTPRGLLAALLEIERSLGRVRRERWGPRTIDLDILWIKDTVVESAELSVPHPELRRRAFALGPLLDVRPEAIDPRDGTAYREILPLLAAEARLSVRGERSSWAPMDMPPTRW